MLQLEGIELSQGHETVIDRRVLIQMADMPRTKYLNLGYVNTITNHALDYSTLKFSGLHNLTVVNI